MISPQLNTKFDPSLNPYVERTQDHPHISHDLETVWPIFENKKSVVDLGCGNGHFLQDYLALHPEFTGLGVEKRFKRIYKTAQKLRETDSQVIQVDIHDFLQKSPVEFWDEIWLQHPDPWPKLRHEKHRIVTASLFVSIYRVLKKGGRFCFRSDCRNYWQFLQMAHLRMGLFSVVRAYQGDLFMDEPKTLYQQKFTAARIPIYSLEFRKLK